VLDQHDHNPKAGVQKHPILELESEESGNNYDDNDDNSIKVEAAPTPKKMKTLRPRKLTSPPSPL
jgi:hypothetical protein